MPFMPFMPFLYFFTLVFWYLLISYVKNLCCDCGTRTRDPSLEIRCNDPLGPQLRDPSRAQRAQRAQRAEGSTGADFEDLNELLLSCSKAAENVWRHWWKPDDAWTQFYSHIEMESWKQNPWHSHSVTTQHMRAKPKNYPANSASGNTICPFHTICPTSKHMQAVFLSCCTEWS